MGILQEIEFDGREQHRDAVLPVSITGSDRVLLC